MAWIQTATGGRFTLTGGNPTEVQIADIAAALAKICRYGGHCREFYSVAQHSVHVSQVCPRGDALWGLLHDASEAYLADVTRPAKEAMRALAGGTSGYDELESQIMRRICDRFGLDPVMPASVKRADELLLATEVRDLMVPMRDGVRWQLQEERWPTADWRIYPKGPREAEQYFLDHYSDLTR